MKEISKAFVSIVALGIGAAITISTSITIIEMGITFGAVLIMGMVLISLMGMMNAIWSDRHRHRIRDIVKILVSILALGITAIITTVTIITIFENGISFGSVLIVGMVMISLTVMLNAIWSEHYRVRELNKDDHDEDSIDRADYSAGEKPKRQAMDKTALLLSMMDEHEKRAFKEALRQQILQEHASPARLVDEDPISLQDLLEQKRGQS